MNAPQYTQDNLRMTITSPFGPDKLLFKSLQGEEALSQPFKFNIEMLSQADDLDFKNIVGNYLGITIQFPEDNQRYINGMVTRFIQAGRDSRFTVYYAEIRPWLWALTLTHNCRIFQHLTVPEIIKKVFDDLGFSDYRFRLIYSYDKRDYCVQYQESAFNFVCRLMEDVGIFYFFEHYADKHTLVLADYISAHHECPGIDTVRLVSSGNETEPEDMIIDCQWSQQLVTGQYAIDDFNFEIPKFNLHTQVAGPCSDYRIYEYAAGFQKRDPQGDFKVRRRIESHELDYQLLDGHSYCFSFISGHYFTLKEHPRRDLNQTYVLRWLSHELSFSHYQNSFQAFPLETPFRAPITTSKPRIVSTQTAIVTGPEGEEIWTDRYGRIKVQFHWDQEGKYDENTSCWIRVNQGWSGKGWGHFSLPRIGQEVIVSFLNGDPDQPLVTGAVYNAWQQVPYPLPEEQTKSTLKSNSSKSGEGFNEIRFEDKKGQEQVFVHAERNQDIRVEQDTFEWIGRNRHLMVNANQYEAVSKDKNQFVGGDKFEHIAYDDNLKVGANQTISVGKNQNFTIWGDSVVKVAQSHNMTVAGPVQLKAGEKVSTQSKQFQQKVKQDYVLCAQSIDIGSGSTFKLSAQDTLTIEAGGSFITLNKEGIYLKGTKIYLNSGGTQVESSQCNPKKPKPSCSPDPCTRPCESDNALSGWKSALKNILDSLDIQAGITPDGKYHLGVKGGYGPVRGQAGFSGDISSGDFKYYGNGNIDTPYADAKGGFSGDDEGHFKYYGNGSIDTPYGEADGYIHGDERGNVNYGLTASGTVGPLAVEGGMAGDSHGNFRAWLHMGLHMADLLDQASKQGTPFIDPCDDI